MANLYEIRVNMPCSEDWNVMTPADQGRFCSACNKAVVDFTGMSDCEVLAWLTRSPEGFCGRFHAGQLNRDLVAPRKKRHIPAGFWQYLLTGLLLSARVSSQQQPAPAPTLIVGRVLDAVTHQPVPFATISYTDRVGTQTNAAGNFIVYTPLLHRGGALTISSIGYQTYHVDLNRTPTRIEALLQPDTTSLNQIVVTGGCDVTARKKRSRVVRILEDTLSTLGIIDRVLTVYPNPANRGGSITLTLRPDTPGTYSIQLFSLTGILIASMEVEYELGPKDMPMNIPPTVAPGNYFARLSRRGGRMAWTRQLVIL